MWGYNWDAKKLHLAIPSYIQPPPHSSCWSILTLRSHSGKGWALACLLLAFFVLSNDLPSDVYAQQPNEVHVYAFPESLGYERILRHYSSKPDWKIIFHDLNDSSSWARFLEIVTALRVQGVEVLPEGFCLPCEIYKEYFTWDDVWKGYASPLTGFLVDGRLTAMTVGVTDNETLDQADQVNDAPVRVFAHRQVYDLTDEDVRVQLEELVVGPRGKGDGPMDALGLIGSIVFLALADSVNPCTFAVFTALLFMALFSFGRMRTASTGLSFILAVFIGYYALGLGLVQILAAVPNIHRVLAVVGLVIGAFSIASGVKPRFKSPVPKSVRKFIEQRISKSYASPAASFVLGFVAAFTLLPCSGGPYLVGLGLISGLRAPIEAHLLLALYNIVFVVPLVAILAGLLAFSSLSRKVKALRSSKLGLMEIVSGSLLAVVCMWILLT